MKKSLMQLFMTTMLVLLTSCSALSTSIEHRDLAISTKMSDSVFVSPVSKSKRTVFIQVRNTSDRSDFNITPELTSKIQSEGYTVTDDVDAAHYLLQVNILKIQKMNAEEVDSALSGGFGGAVLGGVTASVVSGGDGGSTLAGAVLGGLAGTVTNAMVKEINITAIVDIQLSERSDKPVQQSSKTELKQGSSTTEHQSTRGESNWKRYRTRVVSTANKVNLTYQEARQPLEDAIATSVGGVL